MAMVAMPFPIPILAISTTMVPKMIGSSSVLISVMKSSANGCSLIPRSGRKSSWWRSSYYPRFGSGTKGSSSGSLDINYFWTPLIGQCQDRIALCAIGIVMDLDWLKDFLALAEQKNFSRAADARNVSQPAFSRRIRALEDWIGAPLFVRGAQGATLTPAGGYFLPLADDLMRDLQRARRDTRAMGERAGATLSIAATHALSFTFFPNWIRRHMRFEALGTLNLISDSMEACEQIMLGGEVHFLLCHYHADAPTRFDPSRFQSVPVGDDVLVPVCAPDAENRPVWPLPRTRERPTKLLAYSQASGLGRILAAHQVSRDEIAGLETVFTSHLAATLLTMAREGHGVAWLPLTLAEEDLTRTRLVRAGPERFDIPIEIRLFRAFDCRNHATDALWSLLNKSPTNHVD
jgi:LysR family transcriptional regulator, hypochlorite-specific transcription factor HypT